MNTYREAVRARVLFGLLALALATSGYSLVIAAMSLRQETRIVADIGAASMSFYAVLVSVILGATSLYRELELKTIFPVLTRRLRRHEYVVGKYLGIFATLLVFVAIDGAAVLTIMALQSRNHVVLTIGAGDITRTGPELLERLNRFLHGWGTYFGQGYPRNAFRALNCYVNERLAHHVRRRSQRPYHPPGGVSYYAHFQRLGLVRL